MTEKRTECTGEKPENPIIRDVVYIIEDIRAEPPIEPMTEEEGAEPIPRWSYIVKEKLTFKGYQKRVNEEKEAHDAETDEALFEIDAMVCENADRIEQLEQGGDA